MSNFNTLALNCVANQPKAINAKCDVFVIDGSPAGTILMKTADSVFQVYPGRVYGVPGREMNLISMTDDVSETVQITHGWGTIIQPGSAGGVSPVPPYATYPAQAEPGNVGIVQPSYGIQLIGNGTNTVVRLGVVPPRVLARAVLTTDANAPGPLYLTSNGALTRAGVPLMPGIPFEVTQAADLSLGNDAVYIYNPNLVNVNIHIYAEQF